MLLFDKIETALWLLTKNGTPWKRWKQHRAWKESIRHWAQTQDWGPRIRDTLAAPDNAHIPRCADAGKAMNGELIMHNGLRVGELSYAGAGTRDLIVANRGVHEPQEERVYQEALQYMPPGAVILELGAFWAFYSMWFYQAVKDATCYCVEPATENLQMGKNNFALNFGSPIPGVSFDQAYIGADPGRSNDGVAIISVDSFMESRKIPHLDILHADTQGYELATLQGAQEALTKRRIDYLFLSTHGNQSHFQCLRELRRHDYVILADVDYLETFSFDGLIVARRRELAGLEPVPLALRP